MEMGHLDVRVKPCADAQSDVGTLIVHRVLGIDANESALSVLSVERALRAAQHIDTVNHIEMVIECRLRHQRNVIVIHANGRVVDT